MDKEVNAINDIAYNLGNIDLPDTGDLSQIRDDIASVLKLKKLHFPKTLVKKLKEFANDIAAVERGIESIEWIVSDLEEEAFELEEVNEKD